jgi:hypothetical protein
VQSPRFATVTGLVQYGAHRVAMGAGAPKGSRRLGLPATPSMDQFAGKVKTWLQDFF